MSDEKSVLIVVDVQNDFCPGGALAVPHGDEVVPVINALAQKFRHVAATQDWHPKGHISFASSHPGHKPYEVVEVAYGPQVLWPHHCVQGSRGARIVDGLSIPHAELLIRKGYYKDTDSYSGFKEADRVTRTGLAGYLRERGFTTVYCAGLATDFCVNWTALDAAAEGFKTFVIEDACRAIDLNNSLEAARAGWRKAGVTALLSAEVTG
ncbi:MAG: bifunctional nicotinamidase/pyrazinamidase [Methylobacteriaceae bacterium]|jgi:nicotinamidase/pyrazinamidase|nr:bifunctional nicotinamidase/pyrazinamidase [Methylobacteriaceae bacterium]